MARAKWVPLAELELEQIVYHISVNERRPFVGDRIAAELRDRCDLYAANPLAGEARPDLGDEVRVFSFERWVVFFRPIDSSIEVLSVVDGARDYRDHLRWR